VEVLELTKGGADQKMHLTAKPGRSWSREMPESVRRRMFHEIAAMYRKGKQFETDDGIF
jgi:hypothetical protein